MIRRVLLLLIVTGCFSARAQHSIDSIFVLPDTAVAFTIDDFYKSILEFHPIVKQTRLLNETAKQEVRLAKGGFDPKLSSTLSIKEFDDKLYYNKWSTSLSIPTSTPFDAKIGFDQNKGLFIDPENTVSSSDNNQQLYTGISMQVGKGLLIDERRAALLQAKLFTEMAQAEQVKLLNKILLEAAKDYWQWYYSFYNYILLTKSTKIAHEIFDRVKLNMQFGESAPIDTVQAKIILQQRQVEKQEAFLDFVNTGLKISNYLWDSEGKPVLLAFHTTPVLVNAESELLTAQTSEYLINQAKVNHPELVKLAVKINQLGVERKLASEYLKPRLDLSYNFINQPIRPTGDVNLFTNTGSYKFGLDFSFPILIRKERAKLAQTKIKIESTKYEQTQTEREIINQIYVLQNQLVTTSKILIQQYSIADNYERILKAELLNLENGESDLFKINVQQEKLILSQTKLLKLKAEYEKMKATMYWAAGVRNLNFEN
jgi:outer membrane protein TolC